MRKELSRPREYTGAVAATAAFFRRLTIVVLTVLFLHIVLDFIARRRIARTGNLAAERSARSAETVQRLNTHSLAQHFVLMARVLLLFLSGLFRFGLRNPGAGRPGSGGGGAEDAARGGAERPRRAGAEVETDEIGEIGGCPRLFVPDYSTTAITRTLRSIVFIAVSGVTSVPHAPAAGRS